jgi:hypothetical protein
VLTDKDVLDAVQRRIGDRSGVTVDLPGAAEVTWYPLLEGTVERCTETRTETKRQHDGRIDLSGRPVYDVLGDVVLGTPTYPFTAVTKKLVRRGTVVEKLCECGNGTVTCQRCGGQGEFSCAPVTACPECRGIDPCVRCHGSGRSKGRTSIETTELSSDRVACRRCGTPDTACSGCHGQGQIPCPACQGKGSRTCPDCDSTGTVIHKQCAGTGGTMTWTEGVVTRTPHKEQIRLPETGPAPMARWYARDSGNWSTTTLTGHDVLPGDLAHEFTTLQTRLAPRPDEIARRATLRHLPLARVQVHQIPHRVYYVFPRHSALQVRTLPSRHRVWQAVAAALAILAVLILLLSVI